MTTGNFNNNDFNNQDNSAKTEQEINLVDIFHLVLRNWYWFVISFAVCIGIAAYYLKSTPKTYSRSASVLIKDDSRSGSGLTEAAAFADLSFMGGKGNVYNEVLVFQANNLMEKVIRRLDVNMTYKMKSGLINVELYTH